MNRSLYFSRFALLAAVVLLPGFLARCGETSNATGPSCGDLAAQANAARLEAQNTADRACGMDADCVKVDYRLRCYTNCGTPAALARAAEHTVEAAVRDAERTYCGEFEDQDCPGPFELPCDLPSALPVAVCRSGQCTFEYVADQ